MKTPDRLVRFKLRKRMQDRLRSLRFILSDAATHVPFYQEAFSQAGIGPSDLHSLEELRHFPIARKSDLLASGREGHLRAHRMEQSLNQRSTTGSCGTPITVFASRSESYFRKATLIDSFRRLAKLPVPLLIADVGVEQGKVGTDIVQRLQLVRVERIFRAYPIEEQVSRLSRLSPQLIEGRPSSLWSLALEARKRNTVLPRPRLVGTFGETLYPHVRQLLSEAFGCRVADFYNCEEVGNVAWECPHHPEQMHVNPATVFLEVLDDQGAPAPQGQVGRVIITNLYNRTMPFIRYDICDRAAILDGHDCSCGFSGQSICLVDGRDEDFFTLQDGQTVSPRKAYEAVVGTLPFSDLFSSIHAFQIIQETHDRVVVNVIAGPNYSDDLWRGVGASARVLHPDMRIRVQVVEELETAPGGKFRGVMSRVTPSSVAKPGD
jgi:phenylacetate-coenzyme A ligase PaaK-like adenylate-forming protein